MTDGSGGPDPSGGPPHSRALMARLLTATGASNTVDAVVNVAMFLLLARLTDDPVAAGLLLFAFKAPWLVFTLPAGALLDRVDRHSAAVVAAGLRLVALVVLSVGLAADRLSLALLYCVAVVIGATETIYDTATSTLVREVVGSDEERLTRANSRFFAVQTFGQQLAGPYLGAVLLAAGAIAPFGLAVPLVLVSMVLLAGFGTRPRPVRRPRPEGLVREIRAGFAWVLGDATMRAFSLIVATLGFFSGAMSGVLELYGRNDLHVSESQYGVLIAANGAGALLGSLAASRISRRLGGGTSLIVAVAVAAVTYAGLALAPGGWTASAMLAINGVSVMVWGVVYTSVRQALSPEHLLGRIMSVHRLVAWGPIPLGAVAGGLLGRIDLRTPLWAGTVAFALLTFYAARTINNHRLEMRMHATDELRGTVERGR